MHPYNVTNDSNIEKVVCLLTIFQMIVQHDSEILQIYSRTKFSDENKDTHLKKKHSFDGF